MLVRLCCDGIVELCKWVVYDDEVHGRIIWVGDKSVKSSPSPDYWHCFYSLASDLDPIIQPHCISIDCIGLRGQCVLSRRYGGVKNRRLAILPGQLTILLYARY